MNDIASDLASEFESLFVLLDNIWVNQNDWTVSPDPDGALITDSALGTEIGLVFSSGDYDSVALAKGMVLAFRVAFSLEKLIRDYESDISEIEGVLGAISSMLQLTSTPDDSKKYAFISALVSTLSPGPDIYTEEDSTDEH